MQDAKHPSVSNAMKVRQAITLGDCTQLCQLYSSIPSMGQAIVDLIMPKVRLTGLKVLLKAMGPSPGPLPVSFIAERLGFVSLDTSLSAKALQEGLPTLPGCSASIYQGRHSPQVRIVLPI